MPPTIILSCPKLSLLRVPKIVQASQLNGYGKTLSPYCGHFTAPMVTGNFLMATLPTMMNV
jgi:hypothetical protein